MSQVAKDASGSRVRVALLYGGRSAEHSVSVLSAQSVARALDPERFEVIPIAITKQGAWAIPKTPLEDANAVDGGLPVAEASEYSVRLAIEGQGGRFVTGHAAPLVGAVDVVFPVLHGPFGEDGTVQGLLEVAGIAYVGAGVLASALAMDKAAAKAILAHAGIAQGPYVVVREHEWRRDPEVQECRIVESLTLPLYVKPARMGSSIGIVKVEDLAGLAPALETALRYDCKVVVEQAIPGRELECAVIGNDDPRASVVGEIVSAHDFYDFDAKYLEDSKILVPAPIPPELAQQAQACARDAFAALGCAGMARVDFFLSEDGRLLVNEVNTIPGFTTKSMFPMLWEATGMPYEAVLGELIDLALERHAARRVAP